MSLQMGMMLLLNTMLATVQPTDYNQMLPKNMPARCEKKIVDCGTFQQPLIDVARYQCKFVARKCAFSCAIRCPPARKGVKMTISNKRHARDLFVCSKGSWQRANKLRPQAFCKGKMPVKEVLQNLYHTDQLNNLAHALFNTSYVYLGMASFYERADVALPGFSKFMTDLWQKELKHARDVMSYVNKRGGYLNLYDIPRPTSHELLLLSLASRPGLAGLESALRVTKDVNGRVLSLHTQAMRNRKMKDPHLKFYLEEGLISDKVETTKRIADLVTRLRSFSDEDYEVGQYAMDIELNH